MCASKFSCEQGQRINGNKVITKLFPLVLCVIMKGNTRNRVVDEKKKGEKQTKKKREIQKKKKNTCV